MKKVHIYQTIFQSTLDTFLRDSQYKTVLDKNLFTCVPFM